ncbi:MAG: beta-Ala-His dipeptidase [Lachnospiraceae bacterium]|nr:beta-Ala-His dipeptidase [Lachnospiraceae bacterium]
MGKSFDSVMHYFKEICAIPHGSYHIDAISDYLADFGKIHGLYVRQDEQKNIILKKPAAPGYENEPAVILQGHMDMVAVCDNPGEKDMEKEGIEPVFEGDFVSAKGTSLGADDGIAVAYALALLSAEDIPHPALEVVLTVNEEVGMEGAKGIDLSDLAGKRLINIDSEEEGIFTVSCAGGVRMEAVLKGETEAVTAPVVYLSLDGLAGGHSGSEIHLGRANGAHLIGDVLLYLIDEGYDVRLISMAAGEKDNAIPNSGSAEFAVVGLNDVEEFMAIAEEYNDELKEEYGEVEEDIRITLGIQLPEEVTAYDADSTEIFLEFLDEEPDGVISEYEDIDMVKTSLNLGVMKLDAEGLVTVFALRSSVSEEIAELKENVAEIAANYGANVEFHGEYPGWEYAPVSPFRDKMTAVYGKLYNREPRVEGIHAGLECGFFVEKIKGLEAVSIGPDMKNVHTTKERMDLRSAERVWEYLLCLLAEKDAG